MRRPLSTILCLLFCLSGVVRAQQPKIRGLHVTFQNEKIGAQIELENLFAPKIVSTIRSGLPAIVHHDFRLQTEDGKEKARALQMVEVKYDIWAQRFHLAFPDTIRFVAAFADVEKTLADFAMPVLFARTLFDSSATYRLRLRVAVIPISAEQSRQLLKRIATNDYETGNATTEAGRSGFSLNLSSLISFFFSGEERTQSASEWTLSPPFRLARQP